MRCINDTRTSDHGHHKTFQAMDEMLESHKNPLKEHVSDELLLEQWAAKDFSKREIPNNATGDDVLRFSRTWEVRNWLWIRLKIDAKNFNGQNDVHTFAWRLYVHEPYSKSGNHHFYTTEQFNQIKEENRLYWVDTYVSDAFEKWMKGFYNEERMPCATLYRKNPSVLLVQKPITYEEKCLKVIQYVTRKHIRNFFDTNFNKGGTLLSYHIRKRKYAKHLETLGTTPGRKTGVNLLPTNIEEDLEGWVFVKQET